MDLPLISFVVVSLLGASVLAASLRGAAPLRVPTHPPHRQDPRMRRTE